MTAPLTLARRSLLDAITHWPALERTWQATGFGERNMDDWPLESPVLFDAPTTPAELPALMVAPATAELSWLTSQLQDHEYGLALTIWTEGWTWPESERLHHEIVRAAWNCKAAGESVPYIKRATNHYPRLLPSRFTRIRLGADNTSPRALAHTFGIALKFNLQPIDR